MQTPDLTRLEAALGHRFANPELPKRALAHVSSVVHRLKSYQRLEFLGDRVLGLVVADMLFQLFPDEEEGDLSRRLAALVRRESCAEVALEWDVPSVIRLGEGEAQSGGARKEALLADVCEALIGAVFLDAGYEKAAEVVKAAFGPRIDRTEKSTRDPKSALQEWAQARGSPPPVYQLTGRSGPDHRPMFRICVYVEGYGGAEGEGGSKRFAEQAAAAAFLSRGHDKGVSS